MVAFVADKARRLGEEAKVRAEVRDASDLSAYTDSSFDAAFCIFGLMMLPDKEKAVRELHRVVKPGGRVVVATWAAAQRSQLHAVLMNCMRRAAAARTGQQPPPSASMSLSSIPLSSEQQCREVFAAAPFSSVSVTALCLPSRTYHGPVDFWQSCQGTSPMFIQGKTAEEQSAMDTAVLGWLGEVMGENAQFSLHATSLITVAIK